MNKRGFTLIEMVLYVALSGTILVLIGSFFIVFESSRVKNETISFVENEGDFLISKMIFFIENGTAINTPIPGGNSSSLSISTNDSNNPIVLSLSSGRVVVTKAGGSAVFLSSDNVLIENLDFTNLSKNAEDDLIRIEFDISDNSESNRKEFQYSKTFITSSAPR